LLFCFFFNIKVSQNIIHAHILSAHPKFRSSAVGADIPREFHEFVTIVAILFEFGLAIGAEHPIIFDTAFASRAKKLVLDSCEKSFFFEGALIFIFECARGA
jgi:hypothetical protein